MRARDGGSDFVARFATMKQAGFVVRSKMGGPLGARQSKKSESFETRLMAFRKKHKDPFKEIQSCLQKRDYKGALEWFITLLRKDKKNTQIRLRFADTLVLAGNKNEAVKQLRIVADELADKGFMIRAIAINKKIMQIDPRQTEVHEKLAAMTENRSATSSNRQSLAEALTQPDAPIQQASVEPPPPVQAPPARAEAPPPPVEASPPVTLPALSLEERMEMEFGTSSGILDEPPAAPVAEEPPAEVVSLGGFDLMDQTEAPGEVPLDEPLAFEEEPVGLGDIAPAPSDDEVIELTLEEPSGEAELELSLDGLEPPPLDPPEMVLDVDDASSEPEDIGETDIPSLEDLEIVEVDSEPEMAADMIESLVGALGEDIDSLIDSIIDDVGSSAKGEEEIEHEPPTHIPLFSDLTTAEFVDVALLLMRRVAKAGEVIVNEGDPGESMFIISTGEVRATVNKDGQQLPVATLRDGDFFGEMAALSGEPRTATVTAVKNTEILELSREHLREICGRHPHVEAKIRLSYDERSSSVNTPT